MPDTYPSMGDAVGAAMAHNARMAAEPAADRRPSGRPPVIDTDRTAQIRERLAAASSQPWNRYSVDFRGFRSHAVKSAGGILVAYTGYGPDGGTAHQDAELIANAPDDLRYLLAENTRLAAHLAIADAAANRERNRRANDDDDPYTSKALLKALLDDVEIKNEKLAAELADAIAAIQRVREVADRARSHHCEQGGSSATYDLSREILAALDNKEASDV